MEKEAGEQLASYIIGFAGHIAYLSFRKLLHILLTK